MMRLFLLEWKRIWTKRRFLLVLGGFLAFNLLILCYQSASRADGFSPGWYRQANRLLSGRDLESQETVIQEQLSRYQEQDTKEAFEGFRFWQMTEEEYRTVAGYPAYLESVSRQSEQLGQISVFQDSQENVFYRRSLLAAGNAYAKLEGLKPAYQTGKGVRTLNAPVTTCLLAVLAVYLASLMHADEKEYGLTGMLLAAPLGRRALLGIKLLVLCVSIFAVTALFSIENLFFSIAVYGTEQWNAPIQSVAAYQSCVLRCSIAEYSLLAAAMKGAAFLVIGLIVFVIAQNSSGSVLPFAGAAFLALFSAVLYGGISGTSAWNWVKYGSVIGWLDVDFYLGGFRLLNFFQYPVSVWRYLLILWGIISGLCIGISLVRDRRQTSALRLPRGMAGSCLRGWIHKRNMDKVLCAVRSPFYYECFKNLILQWGLLFLLIFCLLQWDIYMQKEYYLSPDVSLYQEYMGQLEGPLTKEKEEWLNRQMEGYQEVMEKLQEIDLLVQSGELTSFEGIQQGQEYRTRLGGFPVFQQVWKRYEYIKEREDGSFYSELGILYALGKIDPETHAVSYLLWNIFGLLLTVPCWCGDWKKNTWNMLRATPLGRGTLIRAKALYSLLAAAGMSILIAVLRFCAAWRIFGVYGLSMQANSLERFAAVPSCVSVGGYLLLAQLAVTGGCLLETAVMSVLSHKIKKMPAAFPICFAAALVPFFVIR